MIHGVKDKNGDVIGMIADATRGIYLRNCRAVWNECTARGFLSNQEYPFSNILKKKLVSIPIGDTRKECYLSVAQMTELYNVFINKKYPETWKQGYAERAHYSLMLVNWLTHSTILTIQGVDQRYISESMGHSNNRTITDRYIANYPLELQMEYNSKLLDLGHKITAEDIQNMTEEQKTEMILKLLAK